ncbi:TRAS3 protein [Operophtera brumata]|uniref:TRAS3 protein n=1 Tax=Operophtera brumata TaxID=104452 RepID=A0A0L7LJ61_OPEBR|nr:TRAS3 protein [Operophtera brumata]
MQIGKDDSDVMKILEQHTKLIKEGFGKMEVLKEVICKYQKDIQADIKTYATVAATRVSPSTSSNEGVKNIEKLLGEVRELRQVTEETGKVVESLKEATPSYSEVVTRTVKSLTKNIPKHSIIVSSDIEKDTSDEVLGKVRSALDARASGLQVQKVRKVRNQKVVLSFNSREDMEIMSEKISSDRSLKVEEAKNKDPLVIIKDLLSYNTDEDIIALATQELFLEAQKRNVSFALVQEPYVGSEGQLKRYGTTRIIQCGPDRTKPVKAAIVVVDNSVTSSDHNAITFDLDLVKPSEVMNLTNSTRKYDTRKVDWIRFAEVLQNSLVGKHVTSENIDKISLCDTLPETLEKHKIPGTHIYTDGSKIQGKVGAAYTCWTNGVETEKRKMKLEPFCTVYQAELYALYQATELLHRAKYMEVAVLSDSRSALETLFLPNVSDAYKTVQKLQLSPILTQVLTGHGGFAAYLNRFKCKESPLCDCDDEKEETIQHLLFDCPKNGAARYDLESATNKWLTPTTLSEMMSDNDSRPYLKAFCTRIAKIAVQRNKTK